MFLVGTAAWLLLAGLYLGIWCCVVAGAFIAVARGTSMELRRFLLALALALTLSPAGCVFLLVPMERDDKVIKPTLIDSLELAYAIPFLAVFVIAWLALSPLFPSRRENRKKAWGGSRKKH
jgi:hypothetical protein